MRRVVWLAWGVFAFCGLAPAEDVSRVERGTLVIEGIPEIPERTTEGLRRYQNTRSASLLGWHPQDGSLFVLTRFGETNQIHVVKGPGGARTQLTFFDEPVGGGVSSPDATVNGLIFSKDVGGGEFYQLFFLDVGTGRSRLLTDGTSRNTGPVWAPAGPRFAFSGTARNGRDADIYVGSVESGATPRRVLEREGSWSVADWSPGADELLVSRYVSITESELYRLDLGSGGLEPIDPSPAPIAFGGATYSPDGKSVWFVSDRDSDFRTLRRLDLATGERAVLGAQIPWDVETFALAPDGRHLAFSVNEDGISKLYLHDIVDDKPLPVPDLPPGTIADLEFDPRVSRLGFTHGTATAPADVWVWRLGRARMTRWTTSEIGGLDPAGLSSAELVRFPTFDTVDGEPRTIPAFYYRPAGAGPFPVVIDIHGGPESQERPGFDPLIQYFTGEMKIAVLAPNVRGSSGYGRKYLGLDDGMRREESVRDIGALLDWIATRPELDAARVAVIGGSYGGYMVLASMAHHGDRLRCGVDIVGISNFVTFLENTQDYRRDLRRAEYGDERDPAMRRHLEAISPVKNAARITKPLFIAQGQNDPRVPIGESEQMVAAIRKRGGAVWYLLARDEGHGFRKKRNRDYYTSAVALFFEQNLLARGE